MISRIAAGDRVALRRLYAFMAMRVWHMVTEAPLCPADAVAVTRSTFLEVWYSAGVAARYDARDWIATVTNRRVNDRLRGIDPNGRHGVHPGGLGVAADRQDQPLTVADYDTHIHRELTALLGADGAPSASAPASSPGSTTSTTHSPSSPPPRGQLRRAPSSPAASPRSVPHSTRRRRGNIPMHIHKAEIISVLRSRGLHARADWVDRELPDLVDTYKNGALLQMLGVDPAAISPAAPPIHVASRQV